ncbi:glycosyltransferase [Halalkalibacter sp. APA_J-10(15)]|uniref:glycosyltransferase n=1 Tax=Halalkalibacter sp. APA_J-10(15) TaxID=2933805 RepID=UPI001FF64BDE|nr:glycosyltransferase [Halalkalibacter sp. APA_J-10(15)]MCK0470252.1 glycosyltransferase [Halalkalibacter sp. APA_J-10(15)]
MKKVKILFFIYQMGGGGAARTLLNIINNVDRERFAPYLVTLNMNGSYENELKEDVTFIKLETARLSRSIGRLKEIIQTEQIDLVFSTIPRVNTIAILANRLSRTGAKNVIREADNLGGSFKENMQLLGFGLVYKLAHQIVSLSEGVKANLVKRYKVKPEEVKVIYNPVDLRLIAQKRKEEDMDSVHQALFDTGDKVIVTAGRLVKQKDQETLIRAFYALNQKVSSQLILLGEGPLKESLLSLGVELGIADRIHFLGFQANPYQYFSKADLFVLTSIHEGFSHVIAEALATGTPVVATDCHSGPREVLDDGKYGELCEVGNEIDVAKKMEKVLLYNKEKSEQVSRNGMERAAHFDANKIVAQYEALFLQTLKR